MSEMKWPELVMTEFASQPRSLAKSSAEQVEKAIRIIRELGYEPATEDEAREILQLKGIDKVNY